MRDAAGTAKRCGSCGSPLPPAASFCRQCGARYEAPPLAAPPPQNRRAGSRTALWAGAAIILLGAGAALAILLAGGGSNGGTTVVVAKHGRTSVVTAAAAPNRGEGARSQGAAVPAGTAAPEAIEAGRYVQAGSFKTVSHAEEERERLAAAGVAVSVDSSNGAAEFYPNFQVLLAGPVEGAAEERSQVAALRHNGVPSAFARDLSPAPRLAGAGEAAGRWAGILERSSGEHPNLDASLPVTLEIDSGGRTGRLEGGHCSGALTLTETGPTTLSYSQAPPCLSGGTVSVRPTQGQLMVSLLPLDSDVLTLGSLRPA